MRISRRLNGERRSVELGCRFNPISCGVALEFTFAQVTPAEACGSDPGLFCWLIFRVTGSQDLKRVADDVWEEAPDDATIFEEPEISVEATSSARSDRPGMSGRTTQAPEEETPRSVRAPDIRLPQVSVGGTWRQPRLDRAPAHEFRGPLPIAGHPQPTVTLLCWVGGWDRHHPMTGSSASMMAANTRFPAWRWSVANFRRLHRSTKTGSRTACHHSARFSLVR